MTQTMTTPQRTLASALPLFVAHGYAGASLEQVRRDADVSNGSLYHHFPRRADLAARLLADGMRACQQQILAALTGDRAAEQVVRAVVSTELRWVEKNAEVARWIYSDLPDEVLLAAEPELSVDSRHYVTVIGAWLTDQAARGTVIRRSFPVLHALWLGPAQEFARHWLRGRTRQRPTRAAGDLGDGAWSALRAR